MEILNRKVDFAWAYRSDRLRQAEKSTKLQDKNYVELGWGKSIIDFRFAIRGLLRKCSTIL